MVLVKDSTLLCTNNNKHLIEQHLRESVEFVSAYRWIIDAYISDFFVDNLMDKLPSRWRQCLESMDMSQIACLLGGRHDDRSVWPLSLLSYRACTQDLSLDRSPVDPCVLRHVISRLSDISRAERKTRNHTEEKTGEMDDESTGFKGDGEDAGIKCEDGGICTTEQIRATGAYSNQSKRLHHIYRYHVKPKKIHEIQRLSEVIRQLSDNCGVKHAVDVGAGQGHLSRLLTLGHKMSVTSIESAHCHAPRAREFDRKAQKELIKYQNKIKKTETETETVLIDSSHRLPSHVIQNIESSITPQQFIHLLHASTTSTTVSDKQDDDNDDIDTLSLSSQNNVTKANVNTRENDQTISASAGNDSTLIDPKYQPTLSSSAVPPFTLTGLHACGDLSTTMLRLYTATPRCAALASVACCYMKLTTGSPHQDNNGYPRSSFLRSLDDHELSFEALEMACHSVDVYQQRLLDDAASLKLHCYRAILQRVIVQKRPSFTHGRIKLRLKRPERLSFEMYASKCLSWLELNPVLTQPQLEAAHASLSLWSHVVAFYTLRLSLAPVIETIVLLDRMLFLREKGHSSALVPIFDPKLSPRNFVLLAAKDEIET